MAINLTQAAVRDRDPVAALEYRDANFPNSPTKITYNVNAATFGKVEVVNIEYSTDGFPIINGIEFKGHQVNVGTGVVELVPYDRIGDIDRHEEILRCLNDIIERLDMNNLFLSSIVEG